MQEFILKLEIFVSGFANGNYFSPEIIKHLNLKPMLRRDDRRMQKIIWSIKIISDHKIIFKKKTTKKISWKKIAMPREKLRKKIWTLRNRSSKEGNKKFSFSKLEFKNWQFSRRDRFSSKVLLFTFFFLEKKFRTFCLLFMLKQIL